MCLPHVVYLWISRSLGLSHLQHSEILGKEDPIIFSVSHTPNGMLPEIEITGVKEKRDPESGIQKVSLEERDVLAGRNEGRTGGFENAGRKNRKYPRRSKLVPKLRPGQALVCVGYGRNKEGSGLMGYREHCSPRMQRGVQRRRWMRPKSVFLGPVGQAAPLGHFSVFPPTVLVCLSPEQERRQ